MPLKRARKIQTRLDKVIVNYSSGFQTRLSAHCKTDRLVYAMKMKFLLAHYLFAFVTIPAALAQGDPPEELANREVVEAFYRAAFIQRDAQAAREFLAPEFIQ